MKVVQFYQNGNLQVGLFKGDLIIPFKFGENTISFITLSELPPADDSKAISLKDVKFAPSVVNPSKIIAIGLNYKGHIRESKGKLPKFPLIFSKFPNSIIGHEDFNGIKT